MDKEKVPAPPPHRHPMKHIWAELKRNWRMSFYCNSMMKNKNLGHLLVEKSRDYTTTTMTMATKTWPAKDTGNSFWHRNMLYFAFHKSNLSRVSECKWWLNFLSTKTLSARVLIQSNMCRVFGILISGEIFCTRFVQEWITYREFFFFYYYTCTDPNWYDNDTDDMIHHASCPVREWSASIIGISLIEYSQPDRQRPFGGPPWKLAKLD